MLRPTVLALTVLSGFTGLAYEVTWQKYLAILLGAHSEATAAVLGLFLGGLSLGYWLFGALTRRLVARGRHRGRPAPLLAVYGGVEAGIGVWCLLFPWIFPLVRSASVALPTGEGALAFAVDVVLAAALIVPPATLMGGTIPILTQALARNLADATRVHAQIYACNTAGAFAGTLATGFALIHWLGLAGTLHAMGAANLAIGGAFALLGRAAARARRSGRGRGARRSRARRVRRLRRRRAARGLRDDGPPDHGDPDRRARVRLVGVHVHDGGRRVRALHRGRQLRGLRIRADRPARAPGGALGRSASCSRGSTSRSRRRPYWAHLLRVVFRDLDAAFYPFYAACSCASCSRSGPRWCSRARPCRSCSTRCGARSAISARRRGGCTA